MNLKTIGSTRQNHALEHATITVLLERMGFKRSLAGRSTPEGFYVYGNVTTEEIENAAEEGLRRLQGGEADLAVSPFCGTNLAVTGTLAALSVMAVVGSKNRFQRLPNAILAGIMAALAGQPLGRLMQKYVTTSADLAGMRIIRVSALGWGPWTIHKVETTRSSAG